MARLLLIDGDGMRAIALARRLAAAGLGADRATSWREALALAVSDRHHLILLDRSLPEIDALALVRLLRAGRVAAPVLVLSDVGGPSALRDALDAGAEDHLARPFTEAVLLARVARLARPPPIPEAPRVLWVADLRLDLTTRTAARAGRPIRPSGRDFDLLACLVRNPGRTVTRAALLLEVWNVRRTDTRVLEASISRLRAKVDRGFRIKLIHTVPGVGYCLLDDG